ncbi:MAG: C25 family peptidase propeptide domain-containing protein, partial [Candidatus Cloacimonadaceae bacterium]
MRHLILSIVILAAIFLCGAETILIDNSKTSVEVLSSDDKGIRLEFRFGSFDASPVQINGETYHQLKIKGEPVTFAESEPELPFLARSVMIPERSGVKVSLVES